MNRRALRGILLGLGVIAIVVGIVSWMLGSALVKPVNHPVPLPSGFSAEVVSLPASNHAVAGWWLDSGDQTPVVLLLPAVRADRSSMVSRARLLIAHKFSVLLIDLQGHGETPGDAITFGWRESRDVRTAFEWLKQTAPSRPVGVIGCSLGGASVLLGPQPCGFDAVVLEAVYPRFTRAVENRIRIRLGPMAPLLAPFLLVQLEPRLHVSPRDLEPIRSIGSLGAPVLVVAGSRDKHTTLADSEELFQAAAEPKEIWIIDGARHQDFLAFDPAGYESHIMAFLRAHLESPNKAPQPTAAGPGALGGDMKFDRRDSNKGSRSAAVAELGR